METQKNILIVDDDIEIRDLLAKYLTKNHYLTLSAKNGDEMQEILQKNSIDLILLDIMMPGEDGLTLCRKLRTTSNIPVILLTAVDDDVDRIMGLETGADDYQTKPFNPRELLARIRTVLRRCDNNNSNNAVTQEHELEKTKYKIFEFAGWRLDTSTRILTSPQKVEIILTSGSYHLLLTFLEHPRRILTRDQLMDYTRNRHMELFDRSIDVQVSRVRRTIEANPKDPKIIKTVRNGGYIFTLPVNQI